MGSGYLRKFFRLCVLTSGLASIYGEPVRADDYTIKIAKVEDKSTEYTFICSDHSDDLCRGKMRIFIGGHIAFIDVMGMLVPGNAYFKFMQNGKYYAVGSQPFVHIPLGHVEVMNSRFQLLETTPELTDEWKGGPYRKPVLRIPSDVVANLEIEVRPLGK